MTKYMNGYSITYTSIHEATRGKMGCWHSFHYIPNYAMLQGYVW